VIALIGYQFTEFRRTRYWFAPLGSYLIFLVLFYLRTARDHPGSYGHAAPAVFALAAGLGWTLCASQDRNSWQVIVVSAGSGERAQASRVLLSMLVLLPMAVLSTVVAATDRLSHGDPLPGVIGALVLYLLLGLLATIVGALLGSRSGLRSIVPVAVVLGLVLLVLLARS
jgi:hypothetical protein